MNESPYAPPKSDIEIISAEERPEFYLVSVRKFVILYLATWGWYGLYWFYRHWSENKRFEGNSVWPVIRALFPFIFAFPLFWRVDKSLRRQGLGSMWWAVSAVGLLLVTLATVLLSLAAHTSRIEETGRLLGLSLTLLIAQIAILAIVQRKMNIAVRDPGGTSNARLGAANWAWVAFGSLMWLMNLLAIAFVGVLTP